MNFRRCRLSLAMNGFYKDHKFLWQIDDFTMVLEITDADNRAESVLSSFVRWQGDKGDSSRLCLQPSSSGTSSISILDCRRAGIYQEVLNTERIIRWCLEREISETRAKKVKGRIKWKYPYSRSWAKYLAC